jgi:UDP-N-acetylglucosamine acyltransferase
LDERKEMNIHPTAIISDTAELHESVTVGPYSVIESGVRIAKGTTVATHVRISGPTIIGENNHIDSFAALGGAPQDLGYKGDPTKLIIGNDNVIREYASIHRGTVKGGGETIIGNNCMIMAYAHIGHDCKLGDHVIIVNTVSLGGHTEIADHATVGGLTGTHQFTKIGSFAFVGALSAVSKDVPSYSMVSGERGQMRISGLNKVGLRRNGTSRESIKKIEAAYKILFHSPELLHNEALEKTEKELGECEEVAELVEFVRNSKRGVVKRTKRS